MSKLTAKEIIGLFEDAGFTPRVWSNYEHFEYDEDHCEEAGLYYDYDIEDKINLVGDIREVENEGGEGEGEHAHIVLYFPSHDVYIKADGYYYSYSGFNYRNSKWYHVVPVNRTVTFYERP